jgi:transposase
MTKVAVRPSRWGAARTRSSLCRLLEADNHLTLAECRDRLAAETGVRVNPWTVGRALRRLDWT